MDKRFAYTDIGDFGSNDCVVRAFMQALGMSFEELCRDFHLKSKGGRLKDGFEGLTWMDVPRKYLCRSIALYKWSNWDDNMTVDEFCDITKEVYPGVDFVLGCSGRLRGKRVDHATFVRDGKFHDLHEEVGKWRCYSFFAFKNGKSVHLKEDPDPTFDESGKYIHNIHLENNNMKKTITFNQLKRLVKEDSETDRILAMAAFPKKWGIFVSFTKDNSSDYDVIKTFGDMMAACKYAEKFMKDKCDDYCAVRVDTGYGVEQLNSYYGAFSDGNGSIVCSIVPMYK